MKKMKKFSPFTLLPLVALCISACSELKPAVREDAAAAVKQITEKREALRDSVLRSEEQKISAQDVNRPFIAGNTRPLARDVSMPEVLRHKTPITALFTKSPIDLATAAQELSSASGISIMATPDALLPPSAFSQKIGGAQSANTVQAPARVFLSAQGQPLWTVLDDIAHQASVSWRPVSGGAEFYRLETKVFNISAIPQVASTSASLGRNGGANAAFDSQSKTSFETKDQNLIKGLTATIDALLSVSGKAVVSPESQTVVVTDSREAMERVDSFIKEQNKAMSRRVRVLIEAIEVVDKNNSEEGVDWSIIYKTATDQISLAPLASLVDTQVASIGYTQPTGVNAAGGSSAIIKALNEVGVVVNRRSFPFLTTSGRPVTQALRNTFNYVDQVQTSTVASSTTAATSPTVSQKEETVGTFVTVVPTAKPDGTIFLSVSFDVTSLASLLPFTIGTGSAAVTVQQKSIDGSGVIQEVPVRSGQTVVIGGIEQNLQQTNERRLGPGAPMVLGGSDASKSTKSRMILLVTAVTEEGI